MNKSKNREASKPGAVVQTTPPAAAAAHPAPEQTTPPTVVQQPGAHEAADIVDVTPEQPALPSPDGAAAAFEAGATFKAVADEAAAALADDGTNPADARPRAPRTCSFCLRDALVEGSAKDLCLAACEDVGHRLALRDVLRAQFLGYEGLGRPPLYDELLAERAQLRSELERARGAHRESANVVLNISSVLTAEQLAESLAASLGAARPHVDAAELNVQETDSEALSALCAAQRSHPSDLAERAIKVLVERIARRVLAS